MLSVSDFTSVISQLLPEPHAGLLSGILFGVKQSLDPELKTALITTGTLHIVALSGMNITILTNMIMKSFLLVFPRKIAIMAALGVIIGFICFVGPSPSIIRAGIMGGISLGAVLFGRNAYALWSWGIAVVGMLIVKPLWIGDISFQLSILASLGMIVFGPANVPTHVGTTARQRKTEGERWEMEKYVFLSMINHLRSTISCDLRTTLAAQTLTIPLLFFTFGRLSLVSPLTNILIVWTLPAITVLGLLIAVVGYVFLPLGQILAWFAWVFLEYIIRIILWTAMIPGASVEI